MKFIDILTQAGIPDEDGTVAGITFLKQGEPTTLSYAELAQTTPALAGKLADAGIGAGDRVIFQLTQNRPLIEMFWACTWIGAVPVVVPPATSEADRQRVAKAIAMFGGPAVLVDDVTARFVESQRALSFEEVSGRQAPAIEAPFEANDATVRLVQMSSGSTGSPKGILLDEATLMASMDASVPRRTQHFKNSMLTWLPLTHNFSLLGFHVYAMFRRFPQVLMPTVDFVMNPLLWFDAVTTYRPTVSVCPNFGFLHVLRYLASHEVADGAYDLSSLQKVISASEPIDPAAAARFQAQIARFGAIDNVVIAAYGMSESCLQITTTEIYSPLQVIRLNRSHIKVGSRYEDVAEDDGASFVSVGSAVPGMEVSIRDDEGVDLGSDVLGEVCTRGTSLTRQYVSVDGVFDHELTGDGFFATGDIGMVHDGGLYVVARKKDVIFVNGKNYYSPDLEAILVAEFDADTVVLGRTDHDSGGEEVVVFLPKEYEGITDAQVTAALAAKAGVPVGQVIRIDAIPKAANGKKMRRELEVLL